MTMRKIETLLRNAQRGINCAGMISMTLVAMAGLSLPCLAADNFDTASGAQIGDAMWRDPLGQCWHGYWVPGATNEECRVQLVNASDNADEHAIEESSVTTTRENVQDKFLLRRINFTSDALFVPNQAVLKSTGKSMLDGVVQDLTGTTYDAITVVAHTDRTGGSAYNRQLSSRQAVAVRTYLESRVVPATLVHDDGKGESQPNAKRNDCRNLKGRKLFSCLRSDRRLEIEVTGTRRPSAS